MIRKLARISKESDRYIIYESQLKEEGNPPIIERFESIEVREAIEGNPYFEFVIQHKLHIDPIFEIMAAREKGITPDYRNEANNFMERHRKRDHCVKKWAWAIPNPEAIECLRKYLDKGIYEIGAGSGYWARMVTCQWIHARYFCFDTLSSHAFTHFYHTIRTEPLVSMDGFETLFLCWPSYGDPFAANALREHCPKRVIYVGENDGCTADGEFHELLEKYYDAVEEVEIPQFEGIHDYMWVFERNAHDFVLAKSE